MTSDRSSGSPSTGSGPAGCAPGEAPATLVVAGREVARWSSGEDLAPELSPRPFLHPVLTLAGTVVSDREPEDHRWHLGVGVAIQDVGGVNLWGGRTYVRGQGYTWLDDHGTVTHEGWAERRPDTFTERLTWRGRAGTALLEERRTVRAAPVQPLPGCWRMSFSFALRNVSGDRLSLGSPATNGRPGAGYGGFFWRFPPLTSPRVFTEDRSGEQGVHGWTAPWISVTAGTGPNGAAFTVAVAAADDATLGDPWFVRLSSYPGLGSSLAADSPVVLAPEAAATRRFTALVADGVLTGADVAAALDIPTTPDPTPSTREA